MWKQRHDIKRLLKVWFVNKLDYNLGSFGDSSILISNLGIYNVAHVRGECGTYTKSCPGWGANLGSFFRLFSNTTA
jgi:hypothetical protein